VRYCGAVRPRPVGLNAPARPSRIAATAAGAPNPAPRPGHPIPAASPGRNTFSGPVPALAPAVRPAAPGTASNQGCGAPVHRGGSCFRRRALPRLISRATPSTQTRARPAPRCQAAPSAAVIPMRPPPGGLPQQTARPAARTNRAQDVAKEQQARPALHHQIISTCATGGGRRDGGVAARTRPPARRTITLT